MLDFKEGDTGHIGDCAAPTDILCNRTFGEGESIPGMRGDRTLILTVAAAATLRVAGIFRPA